ncbi:MFS transporter [Clostridium transplantifaecale]|uniref:MFS transporter n=1 Tax=Clostridium transplantifaecale TaxID=2479838 RepID=UPI000F6319AE|nr:MFS transporter [Clostridium transplantifaecale]
MGKQEGKYGYSGDEYLKFKKYAMYMLIGFSIMYCFFYNGRQNMNLAIPLMIEEFGVTKADMGMVTSALFWCYGFGHLFSGRLGEMVGNKRFIFWGVVLSALLNLIISFQASLIVIAILWGINGFAQSMAWSPGIALSNKWWPKDKRGFASGVITGASGVAQVVTYFCVLIAYQISPNMGWRAAFRWPLIPMLIILVVFVALVKNSPMDVGLPEFEEEDKEAAALEAARMKELQGKGAVYPFLCLLREPKMCVFLFIIAIGGIGRYGMLTWVPTYFKEALGMDIKSGIFASVLLPVGQAAAFFLMPYLTDKVFKGKREPVLVICGFISAISLILFPRITSLGMASVMLLFVGFFSSVNGIVWAFAGDIGTRAFAGTATGLLDWAAYMGAAVQSILFGYVSSYSWNAVFITIAILYVALVILALAAKNMKVRGTAQ